VALVVCGVLALGVLNWDLPEPLLIFFATARRGLDDPGSLMPPPSYHAMAAEQLPWIEIADELPRYAHGSRNNQMPVSYGPRRS
jgi:hypothetical protein